AAHGEPPLAPRAEGTDAGDRLGAPPALSRPQAHGTAAGLPPHHPRGSGDGDSLRRLEFARQRDPGPPLEARGTGLERGGPPPAGGARRPRREAATRLPRRRAPLGTLSAGLPWARLPGESGAGRRDPPGEGDRGRWRA